MTDTTQVNPTNQDETSPGISTETRPVNINGQELYVSILRYHRAYADINEAQRLAYEAMEALATELPTMPHAELQRSVCFIIDATEIASSLPEGALEIWAESAVNNQQTQQFLFSIFKRPVFEINVLPGIDTAALNAQLRAADTSKNTATFTASLDDALDLATRQLRIAHRL